MATCVFHSFSYAGWLPCTKYDRGCGSRKFSTLSRKTREGKQRRRRKMLNKARSKNQQGGYYFPFALVVLHLQFQPLGIISYAIWPVCKSDLFRLPEGESMEA